MNRLIYIADDNVSICQMTEKLLNKSGHDVVCFDNGDSLFSAYQDKACDLVILDAIMPGNDGFVIGMKIKQLSNTPVIILTGKRMSDDDYGFGISLGFDAYLTKPYSPVKLEAHVRSLLIKSEFTGVAQPSAKAVTVLTYGDIIIYPDKLTVNCNNTELQLTNIEFNMLAFILENQNRAVSRGELLNKIWGNDSFVGPRATDDIIKRLRRKLLEAESKVSIETVYGFGFRLGVNK
ncbi:MAG: response regulator transcription factor [Defluviitaleaceae bacterium]|nr:response regulator transcription factor [Defluviitaleaceae bacterium]